MKGCATEIVLIQGTTGMSNQWWILGEANEAGAPLKILHSFIFCTCFFRDHHDLGRKIAKYEIKSK